MAQHGRVLAFDRPGFGLTERVLPAEGLPWSLQPRTWGENPYTARFAARMLFGMLDRLGVDECVLVSHSLGAQVTRCHCVY
jgi:pimeloyl-ACP methyl ester carboxylesterase